MSDPFAAALDAQFNAPGSAAAVYVPAEGQFVAVRTIRSQPDETLTMGDTQIVVGSNIFELRRSEVGHPEDGAMLILGGFVDGAVVTGGEIFRLTGEPMLDVEGLTWKIGGQPQWPRAFSAFSIATWHRSSPSAASRDSERAKRRNRGRIASNSSSNPANVVPMSFVDG